jgi:Putative adhesin
MKSKILTPFLRSLLLASLCTFAAAALRADDEGETVKVKLSAPDKPSSLRIDVPWAEVHITGVDGDTVTVESTINQKGSKEGRSDGLRRLDDEVSFELTEHNNVVSLRLAGENPWANHDAEFKISVPRTMALDVKTEIGGDLTVKDVAGDIEIANMNGEVRLEGLSGSTVVSTMNGEVHAIYAKAPQKLVSITSMNGEIDLRVPADTKANVRLRTHNGSILTDFDETVLKTKSEGKNGNYSGNYGSDAARAAADAARAAMQIARDVAREVSREVERATKEDEDSDDSSPTASANGAPRPPRAPHLAHAPMAPLPPMPPMSGGKTVTGTLNGGGVDLKISTMNGEITLRQTK